MKVIEITYKGHKFTDRDVVNIEEWIPAGMFVYNPHSVRPWLIYGEFGTLCVVFAQSEQDAFDIAVDDGRLDSHQIPDAEHNIDCATNCNALHAGNASEAFDQTYLGIVEIPNVSLSFSFMVSGHSELGYSSVEEA